MANSLLWLLQTLRLAYQACSSAKFIATPKTTKQFSLPNSRKSNLANSSLMPAKVTGRVQNRLSIRWTSYIYLYASGVYELQMQTSTNRLNPDSHHLMHCFIYYKHRHDFGSDGQNCHTREFNDHLLQPFWNRRFQSVPWISYWSSSRFFEKQKQKAAFVTLYPKQKRGDIEQIWCDF